MAMVVKKEKEVSLKSSEKMVKVSTRVKSKAKKAVERAENTFPLNKVKDNASYAEFFKESQNPALIAQYVRTYQFNQRKGNAQTKTRGDVAGSGRKPWKQKGTGRSRVGSIRTPVWRHGGVSHGPVAKDWSLKMPKKMKSKVFLIELSNKVLKAKAFYVEEFKISEGRTKEVLALIKGWNLFGRLLLVISKANQNLQRGASNLVNVQVVDYKNLNAYQLLRANAVIFEKDALDKVKEKYD
jgi:large subunit ribosomal protein L4